MRATAVLLAVAAAAALAGGGGACKGDGDAAVVAVVPGAPAGDVTELSGAVHATRDGVPRALAMGDVVSGDDVIATGGDGRVTIVLRHNQVGWTLGPGKEKKVGDSAAWAAAKGAAAEVSTDDKSAAAGRHAERSAADTAASTGAAGGSSAPAGSGSGSGSAAGSGSGGSAAVNGSDLTAQLAQASDEATRRELERQLAAAQVQAQQKAGEQGAKGKRDWKQTTDHTCSPGDPLCDGDFDAPGGGSAVVEGATDTTEYLRVLRAHAADVRACYDKLLETHSGAAGKLVLHVTVGARGKPTAVDVTGDDALAPMRDCVKTALRAMSFPAPAGAISFTLPMRFQPD